jgi:hypothetical protein
MRRCSGPKLRVLLPIVTLLGTASPACPAGAQDMPDTLPELPADAAAPQADGAEAEPSTAADGSAEPPSVGLRLEAQLLGAVSFPSAGEPGGVATGFGITYGVGWGAIPIMIGLDFMSVGRSSTKTSRITTIDGETVLPVTRTSSDRLLDFDVWLRVQPPRWPVRPYAEGFVGAKLVETRYATTSEGDEEEATDGGDDAWTRVLGWGVGVDFMGLFSPVASFSLTLGVRRVHGAEVELKRPVLVDGRGAAVRRSVSTDETILMAGLCGRYDFVSEE